MGYESPTARELARAVGEAAVERGCALTNPEDPSVAELVLQSALFSLRREDVLQEA